MECVNATATNVTNLVCLLNDTAASAVANNFTDGDQVPNFMVAYTLIPILLLEFGLSTFANVVLLVLIGRSHESLTTLNVFLSSLGILNLILSANQPILLGLILNEGRPIPKEICHVTFAIQTLGNSGITFLQLAISYNRYHTTVNPIHWESSLRKAWVSTGVIWAVSFLLAALLSIIHIWGIQGNAHFCFWPTFDAHIPFKFILHAVLYIIIVISIVIAAYYYRKTIKLHHENHMALVREMEMNLDIQFYEKEQNSPEKTTKSLVAVFVIQMTSLMIPLSYDIVRVFVIAIKSTITSDPSDPSPTVFLLVLTTVSLFTTTAPFFMILLSRRFKKNVASVFSCKCRCESNKVHLENPNTSRASNRPEAERKPTVPKEQREIDLSVFVGEMPSDKYKVARNRLESITVMELQSIDYADEEEGGACSEEDRRRAKVSVGESAVQSGLVLATAKHNETIKHFFAKDKNEG